jgi:hypothetical protein
MGKTTETIGSVYFSVEIHFARQVLSSEADAKPQFQPKKIHYPRNGCWILVQPQEWNCAWGSQCTHISTLPRRLPADCAATHHRCACLKKPSVIAYAIFLISRLIAGDASLWTVAESTMNELLVPALGVVADTFERYPVMPSDLEQHEFSDYALSQFEECLDRIERARGATLAEISQVTERAIEQDDA